MDHYTVANQLVTISYTMYYEGRVYGPYYENRYYTVGSYRATGAGYKDWKDRIAKGLYAGTTLTAWRRTLKVYPNGFVRSGNGASPWRDYHVRFGAAQISDAAIPLSPITSFLGGDIEIKAVAKARTNLVKSFRKAQVSFETGVFFGELREAIKLVKSPLKSLENFTRENWKQLAKDVRGFRNGERLDRSSHILRAATDSWLAYQYGAKPFVNDINAASQLLEKHFGQRPFTIVPLVGSASESSMAHFGTMVGSKSFDNGNITFGGAGGAWFMRDTKTTFDVRYKGAYKSRNSTNTFTWPQQLGLTPDNWLPTLYELVPWSFVIDYFSNAGAVIDAFSFQFIDLEWLIETKRQTVEHTVSNMRNDSPPWYPPGNNPDLRYNIAYGGQIIDRHTLVSRAPTSNQYVPPISLKIPGLGQDLNLAALINSSMPFRGRR